MVDGRGARADRWVAGATLVMKELSVVTEGQPWTVEGNVVVGAMGISSLVLRSGGLKVRLAQGNCVGEFKGKGSGRVFGNDQR